jgi:hypothetical protein
MQIFFLVNEKKTPKLAKNSRIFAAVVWTPGAGTEFETRSQLFFFTFVYYIENKVQQLIN